MSGTRNLRKDLGGEPKNSSLLKEYNPNYILLIYLYTNSQV